MEAREIRRILESEICVVLEEIVHSNSKEKRFNERYSLAEFLVEGDFALANVNRRASRSWGPEGQGYSDVAEYNLIFLAHSSGVVTLIGGFDLFGCACVYPVPKLVGLEEKGGIITSTVDLLKSHGYGDKIRTDKMEAVLTSEGFFFKCDSFWQLPEVRMLNYTI